MRANHYQRIFVRLAIVMSCNGLFLLNAVAQQGFYIPKNATVHFSGDSSSIFSNVQNNGTMALGKKSFLHFFGQSWKNDADGLITDETGNASGVSGTVKFMGDQKQELSGGYNTVLKNGPSFYDIQVENSVGLSITETNTKVRHEIALLKGHVFLNDNIFILGDQQQAGTITGYDSTRFFVTNNASGSGMLLREGVNKNTGSQVFPIGSNENSYTPLFLTSLSDSTTDFYATVFDSVKTKAIIGDAVIESTVNKTWQVGQLDAAVSAPVNISLQHQSTEEGIMFAQYRDAAYISQFDADAWDMDTMPRVAGSSSNINSRLFPDGISSSVYLTTMVAGPLPHSLEIYVWLSVYRESNNRVYLNWQVAGEENVSNFIIQRKLSNEVEFNDVGAVSVKAPYPGDYRSRDANSYSGISFYRLKIKHNDSSTTYSKVIPVSGIAGDVVRVMWPNPSRGTVNIGMNNPDEVDRLILFNVSGQVIVQEKVNGRSLIQLNGIRTGTYFLSFLNWKGEKMETKELQVKN